MLLLLTRAPMVSAQSSVLTVQLAWLLQLPLHARLLMNVRAEALTQPGATPTVPIPLSMCAETQPATRVP